MKLFEGGRTPSAGSGLQTSFHPSWSTRTVAHTLQGQKRQGSGEEGGMKSEASISRKKKNIERESYRIAERERRKDLVTIGPIRLKKSARRT